MQSWLERGQEYYHKSSIKERIKTTLSSIEFQSPRGLRLAERLRTGDRTGSTGLHSANRRALATQSEWTVACLDARKGVGDCGRGERTECGGRLVGRSDVEGKRFLDDQTQSARLSHTVILSLGGKPWRKAGLRRCTGRKGFEPGPRWEFEVHEFAVDFALAASVHLW